MDPLEIETIELELFIDAVRRRHGYDFANYARASLTRRVRGLAHKFGRASISGLIPMVMRDEGILPEILSNLSVPVTEMFRDPVVFKAMREQVIPVLRSFPRINVWQAGCATGEEVYSLAILLAEEGLLDKAMIYATDINDTALHAAEEGVYPIEALEVHERNYRRAGGKGTLQDYYHERYGFGRMDESLRSKIVFAHHNLGADGVFCEMELVLCRNVFIYFDNTLQNKVLRLFRDSLARGGFLCIGTKECIRFSEVMESFRVIAQNERIFQKRPEAEGAQ